MMTTVQFINNLKSYICTQLDVMSKNTPIIGVAKPLITRALNKNIGKLSNILDMISEEDGSIDVDGILDEMFENIVSANPFSVHTPFIGDVEMGGGYIKLNIPLTDKKLVLDIEDLKTFKEMLINKE